MVSIPSKDGKNHTVARKIKKKMCIYLSPDLGQEEFRPAGPFVPPTSHHLKIEMGILGFSTDFWLKPECKYIPQFTAQLVFPPKSVIPGQQRSEQ